MMEQDKKPPVSAPHHTAATTQAPVTAPSPTPAKLPAARQGFWAAREYRLAMAVLGVFLALAAGVYVMKVVVKSKESQEPTEVVQAGHLDSLQLSLQDPPKAPVREPAPVVPAVRVSPPVVPARNDVPMILELEPPPLVTPNDPPLILPKDIPIIDPPIVEVDAPPVRKDGFSNARKTDPIRLEVPLILDEPPVIKNPVIRIGANDLKKDPPPKIELPGIPDPPPSIDITPKKKADVPIIDITPKRIDDPPLIIDINPKKKDDPPLIIDVTPKKKDDVPLIDITPKKSDEPPLIIDIGPKRNDIPPPVLDVGPKKTNPPATAADYDEDLHPFKKEDTYRSISKLYYNSDAYAIALQRYNRDHPGQADYVRLPPIWVLEKKYANDVASNPTRSASFSPPPSVDLTPRNDQIYTVGDNGEMLADIARKTLGNEESWKRIWDLNSQINPAKLIPGGTRLRLP